MAADRIVQPGPGNIASVKISGRNIHKRKKKPRPKHFKLWVILILAGFVLLYTGLWLFQFTSLRSSRAAVAAFGAPGKDALHQVMERIHEDSLQERQDKTDTALLPSPEELKQEPDELDIMIETFGGMTIDSNFTLHIQDENTSYLCMAESEDHMLIQVDDTKYLIQDGDLSKIDKDGQMGGLTNNDDVLYNGYERIQEILNILSDVFMQIESLDTIHAVDSGGYTYYVQGHLQNTGNPVLTFELSGAELNVTVMLSNINNTHIPPLPSV